ncbi:MAG: ATPase, T2SS/T4P/T4SS family [Lachnospiraceae bacterium]|nr:ATPase, T2SS/T4P/T4SS family [Lachnospiraceae bacterium]
MIHKKVRIGDLLISQGLINEGQLNVALREQKIRNTKLGETLIAMGFISQEDFADVLSTQMGIGTVNLRQVGIDENAVKLVSEELMKKNVLIPFGFDEKNPNILKVAMADPMNFMAIDDVSIVTNMEVIPFFCPSVQISLQLDRLYGKKQAMRAAEQYQQEHAREMEQLAAMDKSEEQSSDVDDAPIVKLVNTMIEQAVRQGSSDIHIEALEREVRVRFRVDGVLVEHMDYDKTLLPALVARIKIISNLDISERRKPQDGRLTIHVDNKEYDVRVSVLPTVFGEKVVMRLTNKDGLTRDKKYLGLSDREMPRFDAIMGNPHGIILVTGPTGSGKSTTCYTVLSELNKEEVNIVTVEDPVEANINGVNQVQVNTKAQLTFASALRSILRQDPDIIMIGEIRDEETANIAVQASITGHLVISTLHTNSTASSITRLLDMGIEHYLIGDSVVGIIAQRLVRRLCPKCKTLRPASFEEKRALHIPDEQEFNLYEPVGCKECSNIGYKGRIGVYEIMPISHKIGVMISEKATADEIERQAVKEGMTKLRDAAAEYVIQGLTTVSEMQRVAYEDI